MSTPSTPGHAVPEQVDVLQRRSFGLGAAGLIASLVGALAMLAMEVANLLEPSPILQGTGIAMKNYLLDKDPIFFDRAAKFITRHMVGYINSCQENSHEPSSASH